MPDEHRGHLREQIASTHVHSTVPGFDEENVSIEIPVYLVYRTHDHILELEANKELLARRALGFVCHLEPGRAFSLSADA